MIDVNIKKKIEELNAQGFSPNKMSQKLGVSVRAVTSHLKKIGSEVYYKPVGYYITSAGYVQGTIKGKNKGIRYHREVVEKHIGRKLTQKEVVHHIDENRLNNNISNLMLFKTTGEHGKYHKALRGGGIFNHGITFKDGDW